MIPFLSSKVALQSASRTGTRRELRAGSSFVPEDEASLDISFRHGPARSATVPEMCLAAHEVRDIALFHAATSQQPGNAIHIKLEIPACDRAQEIIAGLLQDSGLPKDFTVQAGRTTEHVLVTWAPRS